MNWTWLWRGILLLFWLFLDDGLGGAFLSPEEDCESIPLSPDGQHRRLLCSLPAIHSQNFTGIPGESTTISLSITCTNPSLPSRLEPGGFLSLSPQLLHLEIIGCRLGVIPNESFAGLRSLQRLKIQSSSPGFRLDEEAFAGLASLQSLDLSQSSIVSLSRRPFCQLSSLVVLNLSGNALESTSEIVPKDCDLSSLRTLDVSHNRIWYLMLNVPSLEEALIRNNVIANLEEDSLKNLGALKKLDLSNNVIESLPSGLFSELGGLEELIFANNSLVELSKDAFAFTRALRVLDLSGNRLKVIDPGGFSGCGSTLRELDLSHNELRGLHDFRNLSSLITLNLNHNVFSSMPDLSASGGSLRNLYLSHNKLGPLLEEVDAGLKDLGALSHLTLDHNALRDIAPEYFTSSASNRLYVLDLSHNDFPHIPAEVRSLHNLQSFSIGHNGIQELGSLSMEQLWRLQADHNAIEEISSLNFKDLRSLQVLDLASNSISLIEANAFASNARLQAIRLDDNAVDSLHTELFAHLSNLTWLNLSSNSLSTFDYKLLPPSIQWLDLHDNALSSLDNHFSLQEQLPRLSHLDASFNRIREIGPQNIPNALITLLLNDNHISHLGPYTFFKKTRLDSVDLSLNRLETIGSNALRLSSSSGGDAPEFFFGGNPIRCDCQMSWFKNINSPSDGILHLQSYYPRIADLESIYCELIYSRVDRFVPLVEAESFLCSYDRHCFALCQCCEYDACDCEMTCPPGCTCYHDNPWAINIADCSFSGLYDLPERLPMDATEIFLDGNELSGAFKSHNFIGRKNLRDLYLNQSSLTLLPNNSFHGLHALLKLHLEDNNLSKLRGSEFSGLRSLVELYLHNNTLSVIAPNTFKGLESLRVLTLGDNRLASWTPWILNANPSLISVSLTGNPWDCECAFLKRFEHWLQGFKEEGGAILGGEDALRCVDGLFIRGNHCPLLPKESEERRRRVVHLSSSSSPLLLPLVISLGVLLGLSGTLLILSIVYRYEIRVWVFARTGHRLCDRMHHEVENNTLYSEKEKLYDAFFAYSSKDDVFVREVLAPELEHGSRLKLCLLYRDLSPLQMPVADSILSAWGSSRRRVLILSEHFLKSEWRRYNYKSGLHQAMGGTFKATSSHLIVIILGNVALRDLEPDIRHYFASCRTLRWGERMFWDKLRYFLPDLREGEGNGGRHSLEAIGLQDVPSFNSEASSNTIRTMTIHI